MTSNQMAQSTPDGVEDPTVYNGCFEVEVVINRPVEAVWKQFLDMTAWITTYDMKVISGVPNTVGSVTRLSPKNAKDADVPPAPYHFTKIVKLVPNQQYVIKTFSAKIGSYGGIFATGFDDARFLSMGDKTKVIWNLYSEMKADIVAKDPAFMKTLFAGSRDGMAENFKNLKRIMESR